MFFTKYRENHPGCDIDADSDLDRKQDLITRLQASCIDEMDDGAWNRLIERIKTTKRGS